MYIQFLIFKYINAFVKAEFESWDWGEAALKFDDIIHGLASSERDH
jgi:hypothetical protein